MTSRTSPAYAEGDRVAPTRGSFKELPATVVRVSKGMSPYDEIRTRFGLKFDTSISERYPERIYYYGPHELRSL
jgi:hypothetical protein